ncbi:MAG: type II toxin-antitoxin system RelE/ParE family toxin [Stellaceae bacterium]
MKRLTARFYRTPASNRPVRDWLMGLVEADRKIVGEDMASVEFGWPVGMPLTRPVGSVGLREVRSTIHEGKVEARVIFGIDGGEMILLHGFEKKPSRQDNEIDTAEARWRDYKRRKEQ